MFFFRESPRVHKMVAITYVYSHVFVAQVNYPSPILLLTSTHCFFMVILRPLLLQISILRPKFHGSDPGNDGAQKRNQPIGVYIKAISTTYCMYYIITYIYILYIYYQYNRL